MLGRLMDVLWPLRDAHLVLRRPLLIPHLVLLGRLDSALLFFVGLVGLIQHLPRLDLACLGLLLHALVDEVKGREDCAVRNDLQLYVRTWCRVAWRVELSRTVLHEVPNAACRGVCFCCSDAMKRRV